jgi:hypothetical protein
MAAIAAISLSGLFFIALFDGLAGFLLCTVRFVMLMIPK